MYLFGTPPRRFLVLGGPTITSAGSVLRQVAGRKVNKNLGLLGRAAVRSRKINADGFALGY